MPADRTPRLLLLTTPHSYRTAAFRDAAERLAIPLVPVVDMPAELADMWQMQLGVPFGDIPTAVAQIVAYAADHPIGAIIAIDDSGSLLAAAAGDALGLPHNDPAAAIAARDKLVMRRALAAGDVPVPSFARVATEEEALRQAAEIGYPVVLKPTTLSGSRGVMRLDDPAEMRHGWVRLQKLLARLVGPSRQPHPVLVERFIPGVEVAVEGLLVDGRCHVLALFDKPDPLDGPFFEETIYVTPSRLPLAAQATIAEATAAAARALGLRLGPIHAELRLNEDGATLIEIAGRSIGGLCGQTLRFEGDRSLEELILRHAFGRPLPSLNREAAARGVMMIPIPDRGLLRSVAGIAAAEAVPGIESITITAKLHYEVVPLPEGDSYLGFIFARGESPADVEAALRAAHAHLTFVIDPIIELLATPV